MFGKPPFGRVGPRTRRRREVEGDARMACEPAHLGVLVCSIVVEDHMDRLVGRHLPLDGIEKEFLMPVACMQRLMTLPSRRSRAVNRVAVSWRL